jgi:DNA-binding NarL/FixJ family response regulator
VSRRLGFSWNEKFEAKLGKLIDEGLNLSEIAVRFGCSQRTVSDKARKLVAQREAQQPRQEAA